MHTILGIFVFIALTVSISIVLYSFIKKKRGFVKLTNSLFVFSSFAVLYLYVSFDTIHENVQLPENLKAIMNAHKGNSEFSLFCAVAAGFFLLLNLFTAPQYKNSTSTPIHIECLDTDITLHAKEKTERTWGIAIIFYVLTWCFVLRLLYTGMNL